MTAGNAPDVGPFGAELTLVPDPGAAPAALAEASGDRENLVITRSQPGRCTVLALAGPVTAQTAGQVRQAVHDAVADRLLPVVCELSKVSVLDTAGTRMLLAAGQSSCSPNVAVCLAGPPAAARDLLHQLGAPALIQVSDTLGQAVHLSRLRSPHTQTQRYRPDDTSAPAAARRFVAAVCDTPELAGVRDNAVLATSELVTNAVVHARTELLLQVQHTAVALTISVTDWGALSWLSKDNQPDPLEPSEQLTEPDDFGEHGRGLAIVGAVADPSGFNRPQTAGTIAWCTFTNNLR